MIRNSPRVFPDILCKTASGSALPPHLLGATGSNRLAGPNQLNAEDDVAAVRMFLLEYRDSEATLRAYTREVERLMLWSTVSRNKPISSLNREDFSDYATFLSKPEPSELWCGPRLGRKHPRHSSQWRPFVGPLRERGKRMALTIINSLLRYLVEARYLEANPLALIRRPHARVRETAAQAVRQRAFDNDQWEALVSTLEASSDERLNFLVAILYFLALRVGEVVTHHMGDFREFNGRWSFFVVGKGNKPAQVPVSPQLLAALKRFRGSLELAPLPMPGELHPLVPDLTSARPLSARRINQLVKKLVDAAAERLERPHPHKAAHMRLASPHWFRHTALTRQAQKGLDLTHVRANARHSKLETTLIYLHVPEEERHQAMEQHTWR